MKAPSALQRGMACLSCRKRKMKCDGARPVCTQCSKANRGTDCEYYEKKRTSRTQLLQAKITKLEARLRELEAEQSPDSASSPSDLSSHYMRSSSCPAVPEPNDFDFGFDDFGTPELNNDLFLANDSFSGLDDTILLSGFQDPSSSLRGMTWTGEEFDLGPSVADLLPSCPPSSSSSAPSPLDSPPEFSPNWWENSSFCEDKQLLLDIFFAHRHQCGFDVHIGRFKSSLLLPATRQPHPSLVDAIYLLACYFSRVPSYTDLEPHFLKRSLRGIADGLQHSDRIVHVLQASCLLAVYFFWHGRTLEGYYHSSIAARLAVGLGLHQIPPRHQYPQAFQPDAPVPLKASVPLPPPVDDVEYAERVAAFWQIFSVDRTWAVATGLPTALPDDDHPRSRIDTSWPVGIPNDPEPTLQNGLLSPFPGSHLSGSDSTSGLRVKAIALFERTARASSSASKDENMATLELRIQHLSAQIASLSSASARFGAGAGGASGPTTMASMKSLVHASAIHLYRDGLERSGDAYQKCVWAANSIVNIIQTLREGEYEHACPGLSTCWRTAAEVYVQMLAAHPGAEPARVALIERQLDVIVEAMGRLGLVFPVANHHAAKVQDDRLLARQAVLASVI
ncbi:fungal-specific transcription factor domain-containing protein [Epithele typhae]|uniref:fungal-specific transcription factor domain-containing protein n=1 Tax=Epithele typhae TaxID=378194 RepID=UPI00200851CF|nr:fungal-specific transcription factor domain-containing protein [Epithele typhae]KAH9918366.1 fungal-specific transcription factor domain-containing protein [Epithele typhae]